MSSHLMFDFSVNKETKTISVKREFAAALSIVWRAYTDSEILDQWWAPKPWKTRTKSMDFRNGGRWEYAMVGPAGEEHWCRADYSNIEKEKNYSAVDAFTDASGNVNKDMPSADWQFNFMDKQEKTLVDIVISYADLAQLEAILTMGFKEGFTMAMGNLDELLPALVD